VRERKAAGVELMIRRPPTFDALDARGE